MSDTIKSIKAIGKIATLKDGTTGKIISTLNNIGKNGTVLVGYTIEKNNNTIEVDLDEVISIK